MNDFAPRVRVKICGVRTAQEAALIAEAGADAIGINFYPDSPRFVAPQAAKTLLQVLPPFVEAVAVLVRPQPELVQYLAEEVGFRTFQLQEADPGMGLVGVRYILAAGIAAYSDLQRVETQLSSWLDRGVPVAAVLLDAKVPGQFGGTGRSPPWPIVAQFSGRRPLILAGGLTPHNVADAIRQVRPFAVDVASGVETAPGVKDLAKVRAFVQAVWNASRSDPLPTSESAFDNPQRSP